MAAGPTTKKSVEAAEASRPRAFNPNEHVMQLKSKDGLKDYLPVQWRMVWFRDQCPQGTIDTEELVYDLDREIEAEAFVWNAEKRRSEKVLKRGKGYARYRAVVTDGKGGRATGTKSESAVNFADFGEKAETGAIGRALAALGYGTQFAPEFNEEHRIVDSPIDHSDHDDMYDTEGGKITVERRAVPAHEPPAQVAAPAENRKPIVQVQATAPTAVDPPITDQQESSIRKLCQHLGKRLPEQLEGMSYAQAKEQIATLSQEYRESRAQKTGSNGAVPPVGESGATAAGTVISPRPLVLADSLSAEQHDLLQRYMLSYGAAFGAYVTSCGVTTTTGILTVEDARVLIECATAGKGRIFGATPMVDAQKSAIAILAGALGPVEVENYRKETITEGEDHHEKPLSNYTVKDGAQLERELREILFYQRLIEGGADPKLARMLALFPKGFDSLTIIYAKRRVPAIKPKWELYASELLEKATLDSVAYGDDASMIEEILRRRNQLALQLQPAAQQAQRATLKPAIVP